MTKRVLAFLMVIAMVLSLVPTIAVAAATPGYTLTLQKAHNQTDKQLAVDVYLTANAAEQGDVTGYGFEVTPAEGLEIVTVTDFTGNDGVAGNSETFVYSPTLADPIAVSTTRVPVATIVLGGETIPADFASALTLSNISVSTAAGYYQDTVVESEDYKGAVTVATAVCEHEHEAGLTWTPVTAEELFAEGGLAEGNYYLVGDVTATRVINPAAENAKINLCLNGYTFTTSSAAKGVDVNKSGAEVHISDCTATGTGEALKAGKFVLKYYRWGNLCCSAANAKLSVKNVILEGAEDAVSSSETDTGVGNAATFYVGGSADNSVLTAENLLIKNVNAGKTVVDNRACMHLKDVTFVNCTGGQNVNSSTGAVTDLAVIAVNGAPTDEGERYLIIEDCKFLDCDDELLATRGYETMPITLKGNVQATGAAYITSDCNLALDLDEQASVVIATQADKTAETFGEAVTIVDTLPKNVLTYANQNGALVNYADGVFSFGEVHAHADGYAGIAGTQVWQPWTNPNDLPSDAGYYYLTTDVTMTAEAPYCNANICLNGHTIDSSKAPRLCHVYSYTRTFCDCQGYADPEKAGTIIGGTSNEGSIFRMRGREAKMRGSYLYLYDIKMTGNGTNASSSAIYCNASVVGATTNKGKLIMERVEVYGNEAYVGGAIRLQNAEDMDNAITITIDECKFHDNSSRDGGGALYLRVQNGVDSEETNITITNSTFYNNSSENNGGAIYAQNLKHLTIEGCEFTENQVADDTDDNTRSGGAIGTNATTSQIIDSTFHKNTAEAGGAIYANTGSNMTITGSTFTDNVANGVGGAIRSTTAENVVSISNTTFTGNSSANSGGGAIYTVNAGNTLKLTDCIITGNTDKLGGGGIYMTSKGTVLVLSGKTIIAGNTSTGAPEYSGDLFYQKNNEWETPLMQVNELAAGAQINAFYANEAANTDLTPNDIVKVADGGTQTAWQDCGRIGYHNGTTHYRVSYFNDAFQFGHWHKAADGTYYELTPWTSETTLPNVTKDSTDRAYYLTKNVTVSKSAESDNRAGDKGLGYHVENGYDYELCLNGFDVTSSGTSYALTLRSINGKIGDCSASYDANGHLIDGGSFSGFKHDQNGSVFYMTDDGDFGAEYTIYGLKIENNQQTTKRNGTGTMGYGGIVHARNKSATSDKVTLNIDGCKFTNNTAAADGAAVEAQNGVDLNITNTVFEGNHAGRYGGAIAITPTGSNTDITNQAVATITNCKFIDNYATSNATNWTSNLAATAKTGRGGAIYAIDAQVTVTGSTFQGNYVTQNDSTTSTVDVHGGAIAALNSTVTLNNCTVTENSAIEGGAIYLAGNNTLNINGGIYSKNEANCPTGDKGGGVVRSAYGTDTINVGTYTAPTEGAEPQGTIFTENNSDRSGGVFLIGGTKLDVNGATFTGNTARSNAAITMWGAAEASLNNTTITGNHSLTGGYGTVAVGSGQSATSVLTVSGKTIIDDNTYGESNVEENVTLRDNTSARVNVGEAGLTEGARIGLKARTARLDQMGFFLISDDLGDMSDPSEYFFSDNENYSIKLMNTQVPVTTMATTPTTAEEAAASQQAFTDGLAQKENGEIVGVGAMTVTISSVKYNNCLQFTVTEPAEDAPYGNHLCFVSASVGEDFYHTVQDAIEANEGSSNVVKLESNVTSALTVTQNVTIDLNGNTVNNVTVSDGAKITVIDDKANDYDSSDAGKITVAEGAYEPYVEDTSSGSLKRYAVISNGDGTVTAHRIYVSINTAVLRTTNGGIGYKMIFAGDETVQAKIAAGEFTYGVKFSVGENEPVTHTFAGNEFKAGIKNTSTPNQRLAVIENIVEQGNEANATRAQIEITGQPFITVGDKTSWGTARTFDLMTLAQALLDSTAVPETDKELVRQFKTAYGLN